MALDFFKYHPWKVSERTQLKILLAWIVNRRSFRVADTIRHLNPKGNVFGLCSVYVFSCTLYDKFYCFIYLS